MEMTLSISPTRSIFLAIFSTPGLHRYHRSPIAERQWLSIDAIALTAPDQTSEQQLPFESRSLIDSVLNTTMFAARKQAVPNLLAVAALIEEGRAAGRTGVRIFF